MNNPPSFTMVLAVLFALIGVVDSSSLPAQEKPADSAENPDPKKSSDAPAVAAQAPEVTPEDKAAAETLLQGARTAIMNHPSLQFEMKQAIMLGDRKLAAEGSYAADGLKLRLEYKIQVGSMRGKLVEICDGRILHTERSIFPVDSSDAKDATQSFFRRDVERILGTADQSRNLPVATLAAEMGIGGLPALLASIDRSMTGMRVTDEDVEGQACQVFHGVWDPTVLGNYDKSLGNYKATLVPYFPDFVQVYLNKETRLPVQLIYFKNILNEAGKVADHRALMKLEFRNYKFDPIAPETFRFQLPSGRDEIDQTEEYLRLLKQSESAFKGDEVQPAAK